MSVSRTSMSSKLVFKRATTSDDFLLSRPLILLLNSDLNNEAFDVHLDEMLRLKNYHMYLAFCNDKLVGVCGYWLATKFYCGKYMEIDNFIIDPNERSKNFGAEFMQFLEGIAVENKCETIMLDAYLENKKGHQFYERNGYQARGYHFIKKIR